MSFSVFAAGLAIVAPLVGAQSISVPGGSNPTAGAIYQPGLNAVVPAGTAFSVTWKPSTDVCGSKVDLVLLKGPDSAHMAPLKYIVQGADNTGTYAWTPSTDLEPSQSDYGIELVCVSTKAYQYTTRFGVSNPSYSAGSSSSSAVASSSAAAGSSSPPASNTTAPASPTAKYPVGTGTGLAGYGNGTEPKPTGSITVPSSLRTSTTVTATSTNGASNPAKTTGSSSASASAAPSNAAGHIKAGFGGLAAAAAVVAFAL